LVVLEVDITLLKMLTAAALVAEIVELLAVSVAA
jgi:hypothetical protein